MLSTGLALLLLKSVIDSEHLGKSNLQLQKQCKRGNNHSGDFYSPENPLEAVMLECNVLCCTIWSEHSWATLHSQDIGRREESLTCIIMTRGPKPEQRLLSVIWMVAVVTAAQSFQEDGRLNFLEFKKLSDI